MIVPLPGGPTVQAWLTINPLGLCARARPHANSPRDVCCTHATRAGRTMSLSTSHPHIHIPFKRTSTCGERQNTTRQEVTIGTVNGMPNEGSRPGDGSRAISQPRTCPPRRAPRPRASCRTRSAKAAVPRRRARAAAAPRDVEVQNALDCNEEGLGRGEGGRRGPLTA